MSNSVFYSEDRGSVFIWNVDTYPSLFMPSEDSIFVAIRAIRTTAGELEIDRREAVGKVVNKRMFWHWTSRIINDSRNVHILEQRMTIFKKKKAML